MGRYFQNNQAPKKFISPVVAKAADRPTTAVRAEIATGAIATPPEVSIRKLARNSDLAPFGAKSAPRIMLIPADAALANAVTLAMIQKLRLSVTMKENRYAVPSASSVGTEDQNLP